MIHPTALVDPEAQLAENVEVGPFSIIEAGVTVGEGSVIGPHVVIRRNTSIGSGNRKRSVTRMSEVDMLVNCDQSMPSWLCMAPLG